MAGAARRSACTSPPAPNAWHHCSWACGRTHRGGNPTWTSTRSPYGDLWHADRPLADAAERVRLLEEFPELQPNEEGITDVADTYAFFAVLTLRYALPAHGTGDPDGAVSCGHVALTAMGMLDQNVAGAGLLAEEQRLQSLSLTSGAEGLWDASVTAGRERFRAVLGRLPR
ncbi:hypothetical protein [Streptomyces sp. NPDC056987]|uniref:hypothetical protein n=1 Tax=Streptomyces sp. NPDC056987 TaxID=3345988 RepID=UPI00362E911D